VKIIGDLKPIDNNMDIKIVQNGDIRMDEVIELYRLNGWSSAENLSY
jgi:hypothetical protein